MEIAPTPSDDEAAAIAVALEMLWPKPVSAAPSTGIGVGWRFSGRWWQQTPGHAFGSR